MKLVFLWKTDTSAERVVQGHRATALMSVLAEWYTSVVALMFNSMKDRRAWGGAARGCRKRCHLGVGHELAS